MILKTIKLWNAERTFLDQCKNNFGPTLTKINEQISYRNSTILFFGDKINKYLEIIRNYYRAPRYILINYGHGPNIEESSIIL